MQHAWEMKSTQRNSFLDHEAKRPLGRFVYSREICGACRNRVWIGFIWLTIETSFGLF